MPLFLCLLVKGTMLTFGHLGKYEGGLVGCQSVRMGRLEALRERVGSELSSTLAPVDASVPSSEF
jgi:hypothetical protein